jgi:hypothetical protein
VPQAQQHGLQINRKDMGASCGQPELFCSPVNVESSTAVEVVTLVTVSVIVDVVEVTVCVETVLGIVTAGAVILRR